MSVMTGPIEKAQRADSPWLTPTEAAHYLKVSTETLRRWANQGRITRYGSHKGARYHRDDLDKQLKQDT